MKPSIVIAASVLSLAAASGCTVVNTATIPSDRSGEMTFVTSGDIPEPYTSMGFVQATRSGVRLVGFFDPMGTDIQTGIAEVLIPKLKEMGADGAINVRYHMTQYTPVTQVFAVLLFFVPLPSRVEVSGEAVKLHRPGGAATGAPSPEADLPPVIDSN